MQRWSPVLLSALFASSSLGCAAGDDARGQEQPIEQTDDGQPTVELASYDVAPFNDGLVDGIPTADVAFYILESGPVDWDDLPGQIDRAQRIFADAGVQLRVSQAKLVRVPEDWLRIAPFEIDTPTVPPVEPEDLYARLNDRRARLTDRADGIVRAIVSHYDIPDNGVPAANAVHVITLADAPIPYYEWDGTTWLYKTAATAGMSFPPYYFSDRIDATIRGFISLSSSGGTRTFAHELGHKLINVSHEGGDTCPAFTAYGGHLMLYGNGEEIGTGQPGRWQRERLHLSPFVYRDVSGQAVWDNHFEDGGIYRDRLYGDFVIDPPCGE